MISTELLVIMLAVLAAIGFVIAFRYGIAPRRDLDLLTTDFRDDHETGGFKTDFGERRERPPSEHDGPGWDS